MVVVVMVVGVPMVVVPVLSGTAASRKVSGAGLLVVGSTMTV